MDVDHGRIETRDYRILDVSAIGDKEVACWSIENQLHWNLDVTFKEAACRVGKNYATQNLSAHI